MEKSDTNINTSLVCNVWQPIVPKSIEIAPHCVVMKNPSNSNNNVFQAALSSLYKNSAFSINETSPNNNINHLWYIVGPEDLSQNCNTPADDHIITH